MSQIRHLLHDLDHHANEIRQYTKPLALLGIDCFYYVNIKNNGDYILLTDCPHVDEYYFQEELYVSDPYVRHPCNFKSGFFLFEDEKKEEFDQSLAHLIDNFNMIPLIGLCEQLNDSVEFYGFWGNPNQKKLFDKLFLNYAGLLKSYASFFKQKCQKLLVCDNIPYLSLNDLIGSTFMGSSVLGKQKMRDQAVRKYLHEIGLGHYVKKADLMSKRQKQCIELLLKGKSVKEIATFLNLSSRTIEHYFDNIKNKFSCQYKSEVFSIAEKLNELGLLS